jgi:hypothetical protein
VEHGRSALDSQRGLLLVNQLTDGALRGNPRVARRATPHVPIDGFSLRQGQLAIDIRRRETLDGLTIKH